MKLLKDAKIDGKNVLVRLDLDVPLTKGKIEDDSRLISGMETLEYLLKHNAKVIIMGHLGRPKGIDKSLSLEPIAHWFGIKYHVSSIKYGEREGFDGWEIGENIFLLENLRFNPGEESNEPTFAKKLASLADVFVNDAFAMCHRNHASIVGITKFLPHFAGFHLQEEVENLIRTMENPKRPLVVIVGGKKIETKLPLVEKMHRIADFVLVGGKIAQGTATLLKVQHEKMPAHGGLLIIADSNKDKTDITLTDAENFVEIIGRAKTIIWNGSMGIIESSKLDTAAGTRKIAEAILKSGAYTVVGGGDTVEYLNKLGVLDKFSFASTGGGAMLAFLSGEKLPGIEALKV